MSRVVISEISRGDNLSITTPNTDIAAWNAAAAAFQLKSENIAPGGVHNRNLATYSVHEQIASPATRVFSQIGTVVQAQVAPTVVGGVGTYIEIGPYEYDDTDPEDLVIRCSFEFAVAALGGGSLAVGNFRLYASTTGQTGVGAFSAVTGTLRQAAVNYDDVDAVGSIVIAFRPDANTWNGVNLWFALYAWESTSGGNISIRDVKFFGERFLS